MSHPDISPLLDAMVTLFFDARTLMLALFLAAAAIFDCRTRRIPNVLVAAGMLFGIVFNTLFPLYPHSTILFPLGGLALGLALFMPLYALRATGAGDVKLLGMVGAFIGPFATLWAALVTFLVGGVLSIAYVLARGTARRMVHNLVAFVQVGLLGAAAGVPSMPRFDTEKSAGKLPYAVAIAIGTVGSLFLHPLGVA